MITNSGARPAILSEGLADKATEVGVKQEKIGRFCEVMWDSVYTDKVLAAVRETVANSLDEHHKHNIERPVEVYIDKEEGNTLTFRARDFALGLSYDGITKVFSMIFESTKDQCNNNMGGFGVGAKAPLSIVDAFTIISYHGGKKTTYTLYKTRDENGLKANVVPVHSEPSDETGLEVIIPVDPKMETQFIQKTKRVVMACQHDSAIVFEQRGGRKYSPIAPIESLKIDDCTIKIYSKADAHHSIVDGVRMGDILYPLPPFFKKGDLFQDGYLVLDYPVGSFDVPISREGISDIQVAREKLEDLLEKIKEKREATLQESNIKISAFKGNSFGISVFKYSFGGFGSDNYDAKPIALVRDNGAKKNMLVSIPNNAATSTWKSRLNNVASLLSTDYNYYRTVAWPAHKLNPVEFISDLDEFKEIRSMGIARLENTSASGIKEYAFRNKSSSRWNSMESEKMTLDDYLDTVPAKKPADCKNLKELKEICVTYGSCTDIEDIHYVCKTAYDTLIKDEKVWGWSDPVIVAHQEKFQKEQRERVRKQERVTNITYKNNFFSPRTVEILKKDSENRHIERLNELLKGSLDPNTLVGKVLGEFTLTQRSYHYGNSLSRHEIRKVMKQIA